MRLQRYAFL